MHNPVSWLVSPRPEPHARQRGGESLGKGIEFQQGYAVDQMTRLLEEDTSLRAVRYEGLQDVDLLLEDDSELRCEFVQLKDVSQDNYTLKSLSPVLASFMDDLLHIGLDVAASFRLVASGSTNTEQVRRIRDGTAADNRSDVADVAIELANLLPCYAELEEPERLLFAESLLRRIKLEFGAGHSSNLNRPFEADARFRLQKYGILADDTDAALAILRSRLIFGSEFQAADVLSAIGFFRARAATRSLDPLAVWVSEDLTAPIDEEEVLEYYSGRNISWSFIASSKDLPRDQLGGLRSICGQKPNRLRIVTIVGGPGAGKSTIAWRVAWDLKQREDVPVLHIQEGASSAAWSELESIYEILGRSFIILVDDIFRVEDIDTALKSLPASLPITILATARANEYRLPSIDGERIRFDLAPPSDNEIDQVLHRFGRAPESLSRFKRERLSDPGEFLALLMLVSLGEDFDQYVARTYATLQHHHPELPLAYAALSLPGVFDIPAPQSVLLRMNPDVYHELDRRAVTRKVIYTAPLPNYLRVGHALIAEAALRHYRERRNLATLADQLLACIDTRPDDERRFFVSLARRLVRASWFDASLLRDRLTDTIENFLDHFTAGELGSFARTFGAIEWEAESEFCSQASWNGKIQSGGDLAYLVRAGRQSSRPQDALSRPFDILSLENAAMGINPWIGLVEKSGTVDQRNQAIVAISEWLRRHPHDNYIRRRYLGFVANQGTNEQIESALNETANWLEAHPDDSILRGPYLSTVVRRGSQAQIASAITDTFDWLGEHIEDNFVRTAHLGLVGKKGTRDQIDRAISDAAAWLQDNPDNTSVRAKYLDILISNGTSNQIGQAIADTAIWLKSHQDETFVRQKYLSVVERKGNPVQIIEACSQFGDWLKHHPEDTSVRSRYLGLVERNGTRDQIRYAIAMTSGWLDSEAAEISVRERFLGLVQRKGTHSEVRDAIAQTAKWLSEYSGDNNVRGPFLGLVEAKGTEDQIRDAISDTGQWLRSNPDNTAVRAKYLGIVERVGTKAQVNEAFLETPPWLDEHPRDTTVRCSFLSLVESKGSKDGISSAISQTVRWLDEHPQDSNVRATYIGIVERKGSREQIDTAIDSVSEWLSTHEDDNFVRAAFLGFVERCGNPLQINDTLKSTDAWLAEHPKDKNVRTAYLGVAKRRGCRRFTED